MKNFLNFFLNTGQKNLSKSAPIVSKTVIKKPVPSTILYGRQDLRSIAQFTETHIRFLKSGHDMKNLVTSDPDTIEIAQSVLNSKNRNSEFFENNIFIQPNFSPKECGSVKVLISDIDDFPEFKEQYLSKSSKNVMLCVGGPAAEDQTVLASVISEIRDNLDEIIYITRDYKESNVNHSAKQSHARHGNALNADKNLTGHALLPLLLMRKLLGVTLEDVVKPDYKKIDVKFTIDPQKLRIYFGNELNWLKQEYRRKTGKLTEHDINRLESTLSQQILKALIQQTGLDLSGKAVNTHQDEKSGNDVSSIHVVFNEDESKEVEHENEEFKKVGIKSEKLTPEEIEIIFGIDTGVYGAYGYPEDTHIKFDIHDKNRQFSEQQGAKWIEGQEVNRILLTKGQDGNAELAGVVTKEGKYIYANNLHFTGGYKASYIFDQDSKSRFKDFNIRSIVNLIEDKLNIKKPLNNEITTATGVSINAVFKKSPRLKKIIEKFGSTGEIAVTNSHWTMIADNDDYIIMRMTGGGNTGSEEYHPAYFLNVLANTRRIFGDDLVGILSTYGCPRAINAKNSTEFATIAKSTVISYGKGGTGNTKRHSEAAFALMMHGFEKEVTDFFNDFSNNQNNLLGDNIKEIYDHAQDLKFFHNNIDKTNKRMGYDNSLNMEELLTLGLFIAISSYAISKGIIKKDQPNSITR